MQEAEGEHVCGHEYDFYCEAISSVERRTVPTVGYSIDRRCFELTAMHYNDDNIKSLMCLICGQIKPMTPGPRSMIEMYRGTWLFGNGAASEHPGKSMDIPCRLKAFKAKLLLRDAFCC